MFFSSLIVRVNTVKVSDSIKMVRRINNLDIGTKLLVDGMMAALRSGCGLEQHFEDGELRELQASGEKGQTARAERLDQLQRTLDYEANKPNM